MSGDICPACRQQEGVMPHDDDCPIAIAEAYTNPLVERLEALEARVSKLEAK